MVAKRPTGETQDLFGAAPPPIRVSVLNLWAPPDTDLSHAAWKANCGPCSLAALGHVRVASVRDAFPWFPKQPWTTATQMVEACRTLGGNPRLIQLPRGTTFADQRLGEHGLAQIQFSGPWTAPGMNAKWAYRHTHFVAYHQFDDLGADGPAVYDVNLDGWCCATEWAAKVAPQIARDYPRADGGWWIRSVVELLKGGAAAMGGVVVSCALSALMS